MIVENVPGYIEEFEHGLVTDRIIDIRTFFARYQDISGSKDGELLGCICRLDIEPLADFINRQFSIPQSIKNRNPKWVRQRFEEFCFEVA